MDEQTTGPAGPEDVIISVGDPEVEQESATVIAATGRRAVRVASPDPAGAAWRRCAAIVLDSAAAAEAARRMGAAGGAARRGVFLVHADGGEPDHAAARELGADAVLALPSCGAELVGAIGRADGFGDYPAAPTADPAPGGAECFGDAPGRVIACTPAVGGAGASISAAALALAAHREAPTLLLDADEYSGGADLLLGAELEPGVRWPDVRADVGRLDASALFAAVPRARPRADRLVAEGEGPGILTGPRSRADDGWTISAAAVSAVIDAVVASGGTVIVDMPGAGPIAAAVAPRADALALIVPATVRGLSAAARRGAALRAMGGDPVAVVRWPAPGGVTVDDVGFATGLDVVAEIPHLRGLAREIDVDGLGRGAGKLIRALSPVLDLADAPAVRRR